MKIIVAIDGRDAIPVRALPFLPCMTADKVADYFARPFGTKLGGVSAYQQNDDGSYSAIGRNDWIDIADSSAAASAKWKDEERFPNENLEEWTKTLVRLLPSGVFVFRDEFEEGVKNYYSALLPYVDEDEAHDEISPALYCVPETPPLIPYGLGSTVMEGFCCEDTSSRGDQSDPDAAVPPGTAVRRAAKTTVHKLRQNHLDPAIDTAIENAESMNLPDVYLALKELAKDEVPPFTGTFDGDALLYTSANDVLTRLTKEALGKRLKRRRRYGNRAGN